MKYSLKELRIRNRMSQLEVAERIKINVATYNAIENFDVETMQALAELFKVKPTEVSVPYGLN